MLLNTVTGPNTKLKAYFIFLKVICCGVEPSQNLELIVCPGDPISGNRTSNSVFYKWDVKVFWSQKKGWEDTKGSHFLRRKRKSSFEGPYHVVRKMVLVFSQTEAGEQQIGWVLWKYQATMGAVGKACHICQTPKPKSTVQLPNILDTTLPR